MVILQKSLSVRIFVAVCFFMGTVFCLGCDVVFVIENVRLLPLVLFFFIGLGTAFMVAGLNVLLAKIEYDDEKFITQSFKKQKVIYFKDIKIFERKSGSSTSKSKVYYWIIKTTEGTTQIDIPVNFRTQEFASFIETMKKANPYVNVNYGKFKF